uniref:Anoctamin putative n=1 Tax=Albugo laibachii Nc14 TaxID=890382 RepID=F0WAQ1_9STRA|nr:anoctamin putative [Albugo laibachii Nc14]|eukprot:CCA18222.1 anoctamin putative [Albugo laibachii Nc14]
MVDRTDNSNQLTVSKAVQSVKEALGLFHGDEGTSGMQSTLLEGLESRIPYSHRPTTGSENSHRDLKSFCSETTRSELEKEHRDLALATNDLDDNASYETNSDVDIGQLAPGCVSLDGEASVAQCNNSERTIRNTTDRYVHQSEGQIQVESEMDRWVYPHFLAGMRGAFNHPQCPPVCSTSAPEERFSPFESSLNVDEEEKYDIAILLKVSKYQLSSEIEGVELSWADFACADACEYRTNEWRHSEEVRQADTEADLACTRRKLNPTDPYQMIVHRICKVGLKVQCLLSIDSKQWLFKVRAPQPLLEFTAEKLGLRKLQQVDCGWVEFASDIRETFADYDNKSNTVQFSDKEKQRIVYALLTWDPSQHGAGFNAFCTMKTRYFEAVFPLHKPNQLRRLRNRWITYWRYQVIQTTTQAPHSSTVKNRSISPHESKTVILLESCSDKVKQAFLGVFHQPIEQVAYYFGEKVAFYFAWTEMYTKWLIIPSLFGITLFAFQTKSNSLDHPLAPLYAVFLVLWASAFLLAWKRKAAVLAYNWGSLGFEEEEATRPEVHVDPENMTDSRKYYLYCKHAIKLSLSSLIVISSVTLLALITCFGFAERDRLEMNYLEVKASADNVISSFVTLWRTGTFYWSVLPQLHRLHLGSGFYFYFLLTPILYGLLIPILDMCYTICARWLTNWENHATESRHQNHLIVKVFSFRFIHIFASLYYYTLASTFQDPQHPQAHQSSRLLRLSMQLASLLIVGQSCKTVLSLFELWIALCKKKRIQQNCLQFSIDSPYHDTQYSTHQRNLGKSSLATCSRLAQASDPAWEQAQRAPYDTFQDFTEMLIQFGYVTFFSIAFPLAPLFAFCNNLLKLRLDAYKLCYVKQRPRGHSASDIGVWGAVLQLMSVIAVSTNCLHLLYTTTQLRLWFPVLQSNNTLRVCMAFLVEHFLLALKICAMTMIPSLPKTLREKIRRERHNWHRPSARKVEA